MGAKHELNPNCAEQETAVPYTRIRDLSLVREGPPRVDARALTLEGDDSTVGRRQKLGGAEGTPIKLS
jgi:hypothetical protein